MKKRLFKLKVLILAALLILAPLLYLNQQQAEAAQLTQRALSIADPQSGVITSYDIAFALSAASNPQLLGSISFEFCFESPLEGDPCSTPTGFDASAFTLDSQFGETGFSPHGSSTGNRVVLTRVPTFTGTLNVNYTLGNINNPTTAYTTFYMRIATYPTDDGTGPMTDTGGVAAVVSEDFTLSLFVPPYLSFCTGISIAGLDCGTATGSYIDFGNFSDSTTSSDTSEFVITTNAANGYNISITGTSMTSGNNTISRNSSPASSSPGSGQFGLNLRSNSVPAIGTNPAGLLTGGPRPNYNSVNQYTFNSGDIVASSNLPDGSGYTASYIVNVPASQAPGIYTTTLTYIAFASF